LNARLNDLGLTVLHVVRGAILMSNTTTAPVNVVDTGSPFDGTGAPEKGIGLCLSGGGYRAMLFHLGSLWRLNQLGYLPKLARVSSVSGGSITAGVLGVKWAKLAFDANGVGQAFDAEVVQPIRSLADRTIDEGSILGGVFLPGSISDKIVSAYRKYLFGTASLQDLPADPPRFVINATNVQSGALWRFSKPYMADYRVGMVKNPKVELAVAVAASSAFPPVLSPLKMELDDADYEPPSGQRSEDLHTGDFMSDVVLTDGGVYDNLGLETVWKRYQTVLVSDGGGKLAPEEHPKSDWARHAIRVNDLIDNQVRSLRKRLLLQSYRQKDRQGAYWGIRSNVSDYNLPDPLPCPFDKTLILANTATRLKRLEPILQERLINWGYAICDVGMRTWVDASLPKPGGFPYPGSGVG
jgi:NTE family protein